MDRVDLTGSQPGPSVEAGPPRGSETAAQELRGTRPFLYSGPSCSPEFQQHRVRAGCRSVLEEAVWLQQNKSQNSGANVEVSWDGTRVLCVSGRRAGLLDLIFLPKH